MSFFFKKGVVDLRRVIISMQNFVFAQATEMAMKNHGCFHITVVEKPKDVIKNCVSLDADALLMEVTSHTPYKLYERLKIRDELEEQSPGCKIVLMVDENSMPQVAEEVKQAKRDGLVDQFIYGSTSASFLVALMDAL